MTTRMCPSCNAKIEGAYDQCPLCQNELTGEKGPRVYPSTAALKAQSFIYKLQLFILITLMIVAVAMEFLLDVKMAFSYSLLICVWVIGGEIWLYRVLRRHGNLAKIITTCGMWLALLVFLTFLILKDVLEIYFFFILPGIAIAAEILHFINMCIDKSNNSMAYLLGCSILCIAIGIVSMVVGGSREILWVICMLMGVIAIIGAVIFKGRSVSNEIVKRFNF